MGKQYTIQAPDGHTITLEGPDGATSDEVIAQAQKLYKPADNAGILAEQAAKFPTSAEQGGASIDPKSVLMPDQNTLGNIVSGVGRGLKNLVMAPVSVAKATFQAPQTPEEVQAQLLGGTAGLLGKRLIGDPAQAELQKARQAPTTSEAIGHGVAAAVPFVGPFAANLAERAGTGDIAGATAEGLTTALAPKVAAKAGKAAMLATGKASDYIAERLTSSLLKPDKGAFDFGADPVNAFNESGVWGGTLRSTGNRLNAVKALTEQELQAAAKSSPVTTDVIDIYEKGIAPAKRQAILDGNPALARRLNDLAMNRLSELQKTYGTTDLSASQLLEVKRDLAAGVKFTEDPVQQSVNAAKMDIYRKLDQGMDAATGGATEPINQRYAGLIESQRLLDKRIQSALNANLLPRNIWDLPLALVEKLVPATLLKTVTAKALSK